MADRPAACEQPVVWNVADHIDVWRGSGMAQVRPTLGHDAARVRLVERRKDRAGEGRGILGHDGTEPDVDRRLAVSEEVEQGLRRLVAVGLLVLDEVRQVDVRAPLLRLGYQAFWPQVGEGHLVIVEQRGAVGERDGREVQRLCAEGVYQITDAGPDEEVNDPVREKVLHRTMRARSIRANGCGKAVVAPQGMVKIMCSGICSASAQ